MVNKRSLLILAIIIILFGTFIININTIYKLMYPRKYSESVSRYSKEFNLDENLVYSVIKAESKFKPNAIS